MWRETERSLIGDVMKKLPTTPPNCAEEEKLQPGEWALSTTRVDTQKKRARMGKLNPEQVQLLVESLKPAQIAFEVSNPDD